MTLQLPSKNLCAELSGTHKHTPSPHVWCDLFANILYDDDMLGFCSVVAGGLGQATLRVQKGREGGEGGANRGVIIGSPPTPAALKG